MGQFKPTASRIIRNQKTPIPKADKALDKFQDEIDAHSRAAKCYGKARDHESKVFAIGRIAESQWQLRMFDEHFKSWQWAEDIAQDAKLESLRSSVLGRRAISHQELGQLDEAIAYGKRAIRIDRRLNNIEHLSTLLHNLGEGLRRAERYAEAIHLFGEAESLARSVDDVESAISSTHNRGLAYQHLGDYENASKHFQRCRSEAKKHNIWREFVRAWEAMANMAYCQGKVKTAAGRYQRALSEAIKRGCTESENRVALNFANLLLWEGQPRKAIRVLNSHCKEYARRPDAYMYHFLHATASEAIGDSGSAETHWQNGLNAAQSVGNGEFTAICSAGLAEIYAERRKYDEAEENLRLALKHENNPEDRAILLRQLVEVMLDAGKEKAASKVFEEAIAIASANKLDDVFVDLYMTVFDHNWRDGTKSQLEALKAFVCAFSRAIQMGPEQVIKVVGHVVRTLTTGRLATNGKQLAALRNDLSSWLQMQLSRQRWIHECILFPLLMVERMLPFVEQPRMLEFAAKREFRAFGELISRTLATSRK